MRARDLWLEGIRRTRGRPNAHLLQSVAVLAGEMGLTEEARRWFAQAAQLVTGNSHGIWQVCSQTQPGMLMLLGAPAMQSTLSLQRCCA